MTKERAKEIMAYYDYKGFGALARGSKKPDIAPPTEEEKTEIWASGNSGGDTINSLLWRIINK